VPNTKHQIISLKLTKSLLNFFDKKPCQFFVAPFDVRLPVPSAKKDSTVVQPDLCIICDTNKIDDLGCNGAPDLVVEILSPGNSKHEMTTKFELYEESGVKEYWLIHPDNRAIFIYTLVNSHYIGLRPFSEGQQLESPLFPEMTISTDEIFSNLN
jgi:Uma2 family endonuclease